LLPFVQHASREAQITPIMVTPMSFDTMDTLSAKLAGIMTAYMKKNRLEAGKDICFLISADANHYGRDFNNVYFGEGVEAHRKGTAHDRELIGTYLEGPISPKMQRELFLQELSGEDFKSYGNVVWCGHFTIPFGLLTADRIVREQFPGKRLVGRLFHYSDSYTDGVLAVEAAGREVVNPTSSLGHWVGYFSSGFYVQ
jgi:predicted class III extradiol MEMO1 family dioxygenase